jgi:peptide/nickel transport system substrate-binding protein
VLLLAAVSLLVTACQTAPRPIEESSASPSSAALATGQVGGINQRDRNGLRDGGQFRLGLTQWADDWNPWTQDLPSQIDLVTQALTPGLFHRLADGGLRPNLNWLTGPPTVTHEPVTEVIYHLQPGARWGDGTPVTVADFQATWQWCLTAGSACQPAGQWAAISAVTAGPAVNDVTVVYHQVEPDWAQAFAHGLARAGSPAAAWTDLAAHPERWAGPYTVTQFDADEHRAVLTVNPQWWGEPPRLDVIIVQSLPQEGAVAAFVDGQLDAWPIELDPQRYTDASRAAGVQLRRNDSTTWRVLALRQAGVLADVMVRQAIVRGLNRATVGAASWPGLNWSAAALNHLAWQPGQPLYTDLAAATGLTQNTEAGAQLLTAAGLTLGPDGQRQLAGQTVELTFLVNPADPLTTTEGLQVAAQLKTLGLAVRLVEPAALGAATWAEALASGAWDLTAVAWTNHQVAVADLIDRWGTGGAANLAGYSDPVLDQQLAQAGQTADAEQRAQLVAEITEQLWSQAVYVPLEVVPETWAARANLANFGPTGLATLSWEDVGFV